MVIQEALRPSITRKLIVDLAGSSSEVRLEPIDRVDVQLRVPNIDKAIERLNFQPKVNLEEVESDN